MPRNRKARTYKKKSSKTDKKIAKIAKNVVMRNLETKRWLITTPVEQSLSSAVTCVIDELSQVSLGSSQPNLRDGNSILPLSMNFKYLLYNNAAVPVYVRVILYLAEGGEFSATNNNFLLNNDSEPTTLTAESLADIVTPLNVQDMKVKYDRIHLIAGLGDATALEGTSGMFTCKLPQRKRIFALGDTGDSVKDNLRVAFIVRSADNDATASVVEGTWSVNYLFKDA